MIKYSTALTSWLVASGGPPSAPPLNSVVFTHTCARQCEARCMRCKARERCEAWRHVRVLARADAAHTRHTLQTLGHCTAPRTARRSPHMRTASASQKLTYMLRSFSRSAGSGETWASCGSGGDMERSEMKYSISTLSCARASRYRVSVCAGCSTGDPRSHARFRPSTCERATAHAIARLCTALRLARDDTGRSMQPARGQCGAQRAGRARPDAVLDVRVLGEVGAHAIESAAVSPVERRDSKEGARHGVLQARTIGRTTASVSQRHRARSRVRRHRRAHRASSRAFLAGAVAICPPEGAAQPRAGRERARSRA